MKRMYLALHRGEIIDAKHRKLDLVIPGKLKKSAIVVGKYHAKRAYGITEDQIQRFLQSKDVGNLYLHCF